MPANPRDPAFEEALVGIECAVFEFGETIESGEYVYRPGGVDAVNKAKAAARDAIIRAVRDTREEDARQIEKDAADVAAIEAEGKHRVDTVRTLRDLAARVRRLNPTPERLYTEDEKREAVEGERAACAQIAVEVGIAKHMDTAAIIADRIRGRARA